jgi:uncharacterized protein (DUF1501 family)
MTNAKSCSSRRLFLKQTASFACLGAGAPLALNLAAMGSVAAQTADRYKALVCVFLAGGNDAYNTVLATDPTSWGAYTSVRSQLPSSLALARGNVLDLNPTNSLGTGRSIGLHPKLAGLQSLFNNDRRLAIVSNIGPLIEPVTKDEYTRNDQQSAWQALGPEGSTTGWGGRLADAVASGNSNSLFTGISAAGNAVWVSGQSVKQYQLQPSGALRLGVQADGSVFGSKVVGAALQRIATTAQGGAFEKDLASIAKRSIDAEKVLSARLPSETGAPFGPSSLLYYTKADGSRALNPLAQQLQVVARAIAARDTIGMKRQVFFVSLPGFDTHDDQINRHADLMARLNHALVYFNNVITAMGVPDDVTTFTASDFGRTFTSNGDGTDHGWGGHQFVMGGAVRGGTVIGDVPVYATKNATNNRFDGSPDQLANGALLPKISVEQYGASLGRWFGAESVLSSVFPNLGNFSNLALMT